MVALDAPQIPGRGCLLALSGDPLHRDRMSAKPSLADIRPRLSIDHPNIALRAMPAKPPRLTLRRLRTQPERDATI